MPKAMLSRRQPSANGSPQGVDQGVDQGLLRQLVPIKEFASEALDELSRKAQVRDLASNSCLFKEGRDDGRVYYLLEGCIELCHADGATQTVEGGSGESRHPLAPGRPRQATATAKTPVRYLRLDADLLEVVSASACQTATVEEIHADDAAIENRVFYQVYQDYIADKLKVPSLPDVALRVRQAVQNPEAGPSEVARIVLADPSLVAHLVRIANSALYAASGPASAVRPAIVRLGLAATRDQVTAFTVRNLFQSRHKALRDRMALLWRHSSLVGAIAFVLARLTRLNPEQALLAGLVHDIGATVVLGHLGAHPQLLTKQQELEEAVDRLRGQVGAMVLRRWGFQDALVTVALEADTWDRDSGPRPDLCDIVLLAQLHSYVGTPQGRSLPPLNTVPAYQKVELGELTPHMSLQVLEEARNEVAEIQRSLLA